MATYIGPKAIRHPNATMYDNASMHGNATMHGDARMQDNASMHDDATLKGNTTLCGNARIRGDGLCESSADYLTLGPAISSERFTTAHRDTVIGIRVNAGCFTGTIAEFHAAIMETHAENPAAKRQYLGFLIAICLHFNVPFPESFRMDLIPFCMNQPEK